MLHQFDIQHKNHPSRTQLFTQAADMNEAVNPLLGEG